jgi:AcrR family transcriptional regulator
MPKYIANLRERITETARRQLLDGGYSTMTIRSISEECGIAVGTVYNYYKSKDDIIATFMLADWLEITADMKKNVDAAQSPGEAVDAVNAGLEKFISIYSSLPEDEKARASFGAAGPKWHLKLRSQLAGILKPCCERWARCYTDEFEDFIAAEILAMTTEGKYKKHRLHLLEHFQE